MSRQVRRREFWVGVEGLALLRGLFGGSDEAAAGDSPRCAAWSVMGRRSDLGLPAVLIWDLIR